jgi:aryl carrier-like protein
VNRDYTLFGEAVRWKQNGTWLKFNDLTTKQPASDSRVLPIGHFPWHSWQVLEPTKTEPTRFRRVGLGNGWHSLKPVKFDALKGNRELLTGGLDISQLIKISKKLRLRATIL